MHVVYTVKTWPIIQPHYLRLYISLDCIYTVTFTSIPIFFVSYMSTDFRARRANRNEWNDVKNSNVPTTTAERNNDSNDNNSERTENVNHGHDDAVNLVGHDGGRGPTGRHTLPVHEKL